MFILLFMLPLEISPDAYLSLREQNAPPILLDVREPWEHATASLPGARLIPMAEIPARAQEELDPDQPIVVLCHHGVRSMSVAVWLRQHGFEEAQSLTGGIDGWSRTVDSAIPRY